MLPRGPGCYPPFSCPLLISLLSFPASLLFRDVAHVCAPLRLPCHFLLVALEAGLMVGGLQFQPPSAAERVDHRMTLSAGLEFAGVHVLLEEGGIDPMAFQTGLNLHRAMLMVAILATVRHGNVLCMVEPHRFVDLGQAAQQENLRNVSLRGRFPCDGDPGQ